MIGGVYASAVFNRDPGHPPVATGFLPGLPASGKRSRIAATHPTCHVIQRAVTGA
jgi:hypothetical protein